NAVRILERNPDAADLKVCHRSEIADDCIAEPPVDSVRAEPRTPTLANLPAIERKVALLIGEADYQGPIPRLGSPLKDIEDIGRVLENIPARQVLLVSDSCYSGTLTRDAKLQKNAVLHDPAAVLARRSVTVLTSGGEEPVADAGKDGHSVFAWHLIRSLG